MIKPPRLRPGDTVGIVSPSWGGAGRFPHRVARGVQRLQALGFGVRLGQHALNQAGFVSDTPQNRAADIHSMVGDPQVKAIVAAIGGDHACHLLPLLDFDLIRQQPKIFMGFSDMTVLNVALWQAAGLVTFNGPALLTDFAEYPTMFEYTETHMLRALCEARPLGVIEPSPWWTEEFLDWGAQADLTRPRARQDSAGWREAAVQLTVNQPLHIPADLHQPTVTLLQRRTAPDTAESDRLSVAVADAAGQTTPLSAASAGAADWSLVWLDMTPWLGQSVTLTLGFETTADGRFTQVDVDEISLGSWLTPVITGVSPARVEAFTATAITVSGANFIRSGADPGGLPALQLNGVAISTVQWHDDATLTALLPLLPPGGYSVWITNPGGQQAVLPGGLQVGRPTYLPFVSH